MAGERLVTANDENKFKLRLIGIRVRYGREYNLPTASEVAALIVGDFDSNTNDRDIILHTQEGGLKRISELHPSYIALQYPLLHPYGEDGPDMVTTAVKDVEVDEIKDYYDCRYLSACEAAWRIYGFDIHYRFPPVERLPFHLEGEESVIFDATESIDYALDKASVNETKFIAWMEVNKTDPDARKLLYHKFPTYYVWRQEERVWLKRQKGTCIERVHHVPPSSCELFYLRVLLNKVRGAKDWIDFKNVDNVVYPAYKDACQARGLLEDDKEYIDGLLEASLWGSGNYLRTFL
ncbi:hypothetical protein Tco_1391601 [Tanacetum coccineum]